jgi:hypothetical protein
VRGITIDEENPKRYVVNKGIEKGGWEHIKMVIGDRYHGDQGKKGNPIG